MANRQSWRPQTVHWLYLAAVGAAATILIWGFLRSPAGAYDDAYITYRYADNFRQGLGLLYNPGEWVLGTTTPLFAILLGGLGFLIADLEWLAHWIGILSWIGAAWAALALFWQANRPAAACIAAILLSIQAILLSSVGMETPLLIMLMLATAWAWLGKHKLLATILAAALLLTRQDSALWLLLLGLEIWRSERKLPWKEGVGAILLTLPWFLFAQWRYGHFLPNSAAAKIGQTALMPVSGLPPFWQGLFEQGVTALSPPAAIALLVALLVGLWAIIRSGARSFWWLPTWLAGYTLFYTLSGVVTFPWYYTPALVGLALLASLGIGALFGDGDSFAGSLSRYQRAFQVGGMLLLCLLVFSMGRNTFEASQIPHGYQPAYLPTAAWLSENAPDNAHVATIEIGVIGFGSGRPILDTMGLITQDMTAHQLGWQETLVYAMNAHEPEYLVTLPNTAWDMLIEEWWFQRDYAPAATFDNVTLYQRTMAGEANVVAPLLVPLGQGVTVTGITLPTQQLTPGGVVDVNVGIEVDESPEHSLQLTTFLFDAETFDRVATTTVSPFSGKFGSELWQPGDELQIPVRLAVPADLEPGAYRLGFVLYDVEQNAALPLRNDPDGPPPDIHAGWLRVGSPNSEQASESMVSLPAASWQEGIVLDSLSVPEKTAEDDAALPVQFKWRATLPVGRDLTIFVHVTDGMGEIIAQYDAKPGAGRWPTPAWLPGDMLAERIEIPLPQDLPSGSYGLRIGLYDAAGRLLLADGSTDSWFLSESITIGD